MRRTPILPVVAAFAAAVFIAALHASAEPAAATQPAGADQSNPSVLVLPFEPLIGAGDDENKTIAVAQVVQRSLVLDLSRSRVFHAASGREVARDRDAALRAAKDD